jgi:hypothetical protein
MSSGAVDISLHNMYSYVEGSNPVAKKKSGPESRMGRPALPDHERRVWRVSATVNRAELDAITAKAVEAGETVSEWARQILMKAAQK